MLWLAREGTTIRESKDAVLANRRLVEAVNDQLAHDANIRIMVEPKPNEPVDHGFLSTIGHALAMSYQTSDPARVGALIESAHAILAGGDPSDEFAFALAHGKLWSVHLNDQNGLKYDQDKMFGSADLRRAFNTVFVLETHGYGRNGECVGLDVKAMRTTKQADDTKHLANSRQMFLNLLDVVRSLDTAHIERLRAARDYETLDLYICERLMGK